MEEDNNLWDDESDDVLFLVDEEDQEHPFQMIDMVELDENRYAVLIPLDEEEEYDDEAIILKIALDENGDEVLYDIEDDDEWERVVERYNEYLED